MLVLSPLEQPLRSTAHLFFRKRSAVFLCISVILIAACVLRMHGLSRLPLWVDEAESSINALTILQHGVPTDSYLGIPIFENTLIERWDGNDEYEFKDLSYSPKGLAIYHGWLPLYSISAAFWLFGVAPDSTPATTPRYTASERRHRTVVARLPSVFYGILSVAGLYLAAARLHSRLAAFIAAVLATFGTVHISFGQQARYYAATLAIGALCVWSGSRMVQERRFSDFCAGGLLSALLFHTHLLTFAVMFSLLCLCLVPLIRRDPWPMLPRVCVLLGIVGLSSVPWIVGTGFLPHTAQIPANWQTMSSISDLFVLPIIVSEYGALLLIGMLLLICDLMPIRHEWVRRASSVVLPSRRPLALMYVWLIVSYVVFVCGIPVASFSISRLALVLLIPATLIAAMLIASVAQSVSRTRRLPAAATVVVLFLGVSNYLYALPGQAAARVANFDLDSAISYLADVSLNATTKIFASPNEHLVLTFYTGIPVQSIAPVRKSFFDRYKGDIIFFEKVDLSPTEPISASALQKRAADYDFILDQAQAELLSCQMASRALRSQLLGQGMNVLTPLQKVPSFAQSAYAAHEDEVRQKQIMQNAKIAARLPIFRNVRVYTIYDWWTGFFYRFVDHVRRKENPAFLDRFKNARIFVPPCANWVVRYSPAP